jgi:protein tyrosine/serine phosphatase
MRFSTLLFTLRLTVIVALIVGPVVYAARQQREMRNFRIVREDVLYRSGQMTLDGLKRAIHEYGIRTIVSLRDARIEGDPAPDAREEEYCHKLGIKYVRIPPRPWEGAPGETPPVEKGVKRFLEVMDHARTYPVLVHCCAGTHRTGAYCAIYRMEYEGWSNTQALEELRSLGYSNLDEENDIRGYLSNYRPRKR